MQELVLTSLSPVDRMTGGRFTLRAALKWRDPDLGCTLVLSQPAVDPDLWEQFCRGAEDSYRRYGVECALDVDVLRSGADTIMFSAAIDDAGRMVGGLRAIGPLRSADDSHAVIEWAGQPGEQAVRDMINDRIPFGVMEMKTGWTAEGWDRDRPVTTALARSGLYMSSFFGYQFMMATAATYVLNRWRTSGGVVAPIPATPYPNERYQTKMIWWDRHDFINHAEPGQAAKILTENKQLTNELYRRGDLDFNWREVV